MTSERREKAKNDLIHATIECIAESGLQNATIRNIAQKVGVNSSAISYYFGSRDNLINMALDITLENAFTLDDLDFSSSKDYHDVLGIILTNWKTGAINNPGVCNAHFDDMMNNNPEINITAKRYEAFILKVYDLLISYGMIDGEENLCKLKLVFGAHMSTIIFPSITTLQDSDIDDIKILVQMI